VFEWKDEQHIDEDIILFVYHHTIIILPRLFNEQTPFQEQQYHP